MLTPHILGNYAGNVKTNPFDTSDLVFCQSAEFSLSAQHVRPWNHVAGALLSHR